MPKDGPGMHWDYHLFLGGVSEALVLEAKVFGGEGCTKPMEMVAVVWSRRVLMTLSPSTYTVAPEAQTCYFRGRGMIWLEKKKKSHA